MRDPRLPKCPISYRNRAQYNFYQVLDHFISRPLTVKLFGKSRYRLFKRISKELEDRGSSTILPVERRKNLSIEEFKREYLHKGIPVVLEGAAKNWTCCEEWDFSLFSKEYGDDDVPIVDPIYVEQGVKYLKLKEVVREILNGKNMYFRFYNLLSRHPERLGDLKLDWLKSLRHKKAYTEFTQVFIGGANSMTGMHNSHADNLFVQVKGEKHWILYPNYFVSLIDPPSTTGGTYRVSPRRGKEAKPFHHFTPDYETYPLYKYIDGYRVELKPGDVFYNPPYMWHAVKNMSENIGVGFRWVSAGSAFKTSPLYYLLDLMAYRPSYFKAYKWHKNDGNAEFLYMQKLIEKQRKRQAKQKKA